MGKFIAGLLLTFVSFGSLAGIPVFVADNGPMRLSVYSEQMDCPKGSHFAMVYDLRDAEMWPACAKIEDKGIAVKFKDGSALFIDKTGKVTKSTSL